MSLPVEEDPFEVAIVHRGGAALGLRDDRSLLRRCGEVVEAQRRLRAEGGHRLASPVGERYVMVHPREERGACLVAQGHHHQERLHLPVVIDEVQEARRVERDRLADHRAESDDVAGGGGALADEEDGVRREEGFDDVEGFARAAEQRGGERGGHANGADVEGGVGGASVDAEGLAGHRRAARIARLGREGAGVRGSVGGVIETISLQNYKGHTDTTIPCARLTVLVGENASGKTSVLELVRDVWGGMADTLPLDTLRRGADSLRYELVHTSRGRRHTLRAEYKPHEDAELRAERKQVTDDDGGLGHRPNVEVLSLDARALAASSAPRSSRPALGPKGEGLASVLAHLLLTDGERFRRVVERLRAVVPIVREVSFQRVPKTEDVVRSIQVERQQVQITEKVTSIHDSLLLSFVDAPRVPAAQVSEGTLVALGIFTALETLERRDGVIDEGRMVSPAEVVLLDDIDRALHPRAQLDLVTALRAVLTESPGLQILATSHSPYLIDALTPEEVVVLGRDAQGVVHAKRLEDFPDARMKKMLSSGELWMTEGDAWVSR